MKDFNVVVEVTVPVRAESREEAIEAAIEEVRYGDVEDEDMVVKG